MKKGPPLAALVLLNAVLVYVAQTPSPAFQYDALQYWQAANLWLDWQDAYIDGGLNVRGVLTCLVFVPAAALARLLGGAPTDAGAAVLLQNAVVIAITGALLIPALLSRFVAVRWPHILMTSALTTTAFWGFAPYPLMDLPAACLMGVGVLLLSAKRWPAVMLGGAALGIAFNLRPAYLVAAALCLLVFAVVSPRRSWIPSLGAVLGVVPQLAYGAIRGDTVGILPPQAGLVSAIQFNYAAYGVRYDTVTYAPIDPRQWYCHPAMASVADGHLPTGGRDLMGLFLANLSTAVPFSLQKVAAALQWSINTPYAAEEAGWTWHGVLVACVTTVGLVVLVGAIRRGRPDVPVPALAVAAALGSVVTLVASAPELRFAALLVLFGILGCAAVAAGAVPDKLRSRSGALLVGSALAVTLSVLALGAAGTSHPADPGDVNAPICEST